MAKDEQTQSWPARHADAETRTSRSWSGFCTLLEDVIWPRLRAMAPLVFATFICSIMVMTHKVEMWVGSQVFLILPYLYLFLNPANATIGQHAENVVLVLVASIIALGIAFLGVSGTIWIDGNQVAEPLASDKSKTVAACTLLGLFAVGGYIGSVLPRVNIAVRSALFTAVMPLTKGSKEISWKLFSTSLYPLCMAAGVSLISNLIIFPQKANGRFAELLIRNLDGTNKVIHKTVEEFFERYDLHRSVSATSFESSSTASRCEVMSEELLHAREDVVSSQSNLAAALDEAMHEIIFARMPVNKFQTILAPTNKIAGWISCGLGIGHNHGSPQEQSHRRGCESVVSPVKANLSVGADDSPDKVPQTSTLDAFRPTIEHFAREIMRSLEVVVSVTQVTLAPHLVLKHSVTMMREQLLSSTKDPEKLRRIVSTQRSQLRRAVADFRRDLDSAIEVTNGRDASQEHINLNSPTGSRRPSSAKEGDEATYRTSSRQTTLFKSRMYELSFLMVSLLQIAEEVNTALAASETYVEFWQEHTSRSIWWPVASWRRWLRTDSDKVATDGYRRMDDSNNHQLLHYSDDDDDEDEDEEGRKKSSTLADSKYAENVFCQKIFDGVNGERKRAGLRHTDTTSLAESHGSQAPLSYKRFVRALRLYTRRPNMLRLRYKVSHAYKSLKKSRHLKFAFKLTLGAALFSLPAYVESSRKWFSTDRGVWALISYLYVLETTSGATVRIAVCRVAGTIIGCLLGLIASEIAHQNAYATVFLLTLFLLPSAYLLTCSHIPVVGIVSGAALSLIVSIHYTQHHIPVPPGSIRSPALIAAIRGYEVGAGIVAAVLINLLLWPYHARVECVANIARSTTKMQQIYTSLARQMLQSGFVTTPQTSERFNKMEMALIKRLRFCRSLLSVMDGEVSLVLRPVDLLDGIIGHLERIARLLVALRHCRERGLLSHRSETIFNVLSARQDLISCVSLTLWTVGQALRTHAPLPQFLPSPRVALQDLTLSLRAQIEANGSKAMHVVEEVNPYDKDPSSAKEASTSATKFHSVSQSVPAALHLAMPPQMQIRGAATAPDAYHALMRVGEPRWRSSRNSRATRSLMDSRKGSPHASGTSTPRSPTSPHGNTLSPTRRPILGTTLAELDTEAAPVQKVPNQTYLWLFAEHSILSSIIRELEDLVDETRALCGEVTFIETEYALQGHGHSRHGSAALS
ncbi:unnamed protein product [Sympodiomycopsis kandeliae]